MVDKKRKASSTVKKPDSKVKKARLEEKKVVPQQSEEDSDSFESFSDSDDGGVSLGNGASKRDSGKPNGASQGKTFERGQFK